MQSKANLAVIKATPPKNSELGDLRWPSGRRVPFLPSKKPDNFLFLAVNYLVFDRSTL